jgi:hypothetical protein
MRRANRERKLRGGILLATAFGFLGCSTGGDRWLDYEPAVVHLRGTLVEEAFSGPPNFGESKATDARLCAAILNLVQPISVRGDRASATNTQSFTNIRKLMVVASEDKRTGNIGKTVEIVGRLFQRHTGHHLTDVVIHADSVTPLSEARAASPGCS